MKIGVIGAGTMGQGIAKAFAQVEGNTVALCDIKQEWAENGLAKIKKGYEKLVAKGKMTQEKADAIVAAITPGLKEDLCADCDLVVEAAFEDMKVKQTTFGELDKICKPECVFASNTSSLSITEIGKGLTRPLIGMHFFNPADRMKLIEVIAGCNTPAETVEKIKEIAVAIGKSPVQVNEAAGFVVNRILIPMINEAAFIKMEGVSDIAVTKQVNRINGKLVVSPPKTRNSIRTLALPQQAVDLLAAEHQKHPRNPYLFPSPKTGTMYDPDAFRRTHDKILKAIGAEHIRFHDLRHTFATLSLKSGVDVKTLSGALGHYSAGFTLNTYTHATAQMKQDAADTIGGVISQQMR